MNESEIEYAQVSQEQHKKEKQLEVESVVSQFRGVELNQCNECIW